jgi:hypothetical protein
MFRYLLFFILLLHGLIHLMGFARAFGYATLPALTRPISRPQGAWWFVVAVLFIAAALILLIKKDMWWITALVALLVSQVLIVSSWQDAKWGTIANGIILLAIIAVNGSRHFENRYKKDVAACMQHTFFAPQLLTAADISVLPLLVQRYVRNSGAINKPRLHNMKIVFEGQMREKGKGWFSFTTEQYNFFERPVRLFFMKARMFGITVPGYHAYQNATASMQVKLFGLVPVVDKKTGELNKAETVTLFNDLCLFAPGALIDANIQWQPVDDSSVKAIFTNGEITIEATLYFNAAGQLVNFVSDDRYNINAKNQYRFSTPVNEYKIIDGYSLPTYGEAIWHYPEGKFTYGKFHLKTIQYNVFK